MIWDGWLDFLAMGGYALYVWGSYGGSAGLGSDRARSAASQKARHPWASGVEQRLLRARRRPRARGALTAGNAPCLNRERINSTGVLAFRMDLSALPKSGKPHAAEAVVQS